MKHILWKISKSMGVSVIIRSKNQFETYEFYFRLVNLLVLFTPLNILPMLTFVLPTLSTDSVFPVKIFSFPSLNSIQLSFFTLKPFTTCVIGGVYKSTLSASSYSSTLSYSLKFNLK